MVTVSLQKNTAELEKNIEEGNQNDSKAGLEHLPFEERLSEEPGIF